MNVRGNFFHRTYCLYLEVCHLPLSILEVCHHSRRLSIMFMWIYLHNIDVLYVSVTCIVSLLLLSIATCSSVIIMCMLVAFSPFLSLTNHNLTFMSNGGEVAMSAGSMLYLWPLNVISKRMLVRSYCKELHWTRIDLQGAYFLIQNATFLTPPRILFLVPAIFCRPFIVVLKTQAYRLCANGDFWDGKENFTELLH